MNVLQAIRAFGVRHKWFRILYCLLWPLSWPGNLPRSRVLSRVVNQGINNEMYKIQDNGDFVIMGLLIQEGCDRWEYHFEEYHSGSRYKANVHRETCLRLHWIKKLAEGSPEQRLEKYLAKQMVLGDKS